MFGRRDADDLESAVARLEAVLPGPQLAEGLAGLPRPDDDCWQFGPSQRARVVALWDRLASWAAASALEHMAAELEQLEEAPEITATEFFTELSLETHTTHRAVQNRAGLALALERQFPKAREALSQGRLTLSHINRLEEHAGHLETDQAAAIDRAVTPKCLERGWTPTQLAGAVRRAVLRVETDGGRAKHEQQLNEASVTVRPRDYGMSALDVLGDAVTVQQIMAAVDDRADQLRGLAKATPIGRLRFAALADLVLRDSFQLRDHVLGQEAAEQTGAEESDPLSPKARRRRRRRGEALVSIDLTTLLSLDEEPGELEGVGPIPGFLARLVAADAALRRLVTDPITAEALDLARRTYEPGDALAALIRVRDRTCRFPGCTRMIGLEIDHITARMDDGETVRRNLHLLCRRHHLLKTAGKIECHRDPEGRLYWVTRKGRRYQGSPPTERAKLHLIRPPEIRRSRALSGDRDLGGGDP